LRRHDGRDAVEPMESSGIEIFGVWFSYAAAARAATTAVIVGVIALGVQSFVRRRNR
jgi:hypothetical protein